MSGEPFKQNHIVPVFMLRYWIDPTTPNEGVHVYDIRKLKAYSSTSRGRKPFSFAIDKDIYVHGSSAKRAHAFERWLSGLELALAGFVRKIHQRRDDVRLTPAEATRVTMAIMALECRSRYGIRLMMRHVREQETLRAQLGAESELPEHQLVLENLITVVSEMAGRFTPPEMTFWIAPPALSWLVSDRPYFHQESLAQRFVVLTNKVLLAYRKSSDHFKFIYEDASASQVATINEIIALQARDWLAADSKAYLDAFIPVFDSPEWNDSVSSDTTEVLQPQLISRGWKITS